ncbi:hypothetical protein C8F01DRAFT_1254048 [Mycena amicta]|nr:hypothetical protein C8F01DRAFT_1254048 [Mycena amicta]
MPRNKSSSSKSRARTKSAQKNSNKRWAAGQDKENLPPTPSSPSSPLRKRVKDLEKKIRAADLAHQKLIHRYELALRREKRLKQRVAEKDLEILTQKTEMEEASTEAKTSVRLLLETRLQREACFEDMLVDAQQRLKCALKSTESAEADAASKRVELGQLRVRVRALGGSLKRYDTLKEVVRSGAAAEKVRAKTLLMKGRAYKKEIRMLARILIGCGCKQGRVGQAVQEVAETFGIRLERVLSRRTVGRIALEGLVMARVQLGFELKQTQDITMSSDSTSRNKQNYQSHHLNLKVPVGFDDDGKIVLADLPSTRYAGVYSTTDHSTATSHAMWMKVYDEIMELFNKSPLARRTGTLDLRGICRCLRGMCGDHANNEKALSDEVRKTKYDLLLLELGEKKMAELGEQISELENIMKQWNAKKLADVGGIEKWNALSAAERAARDLATTTAMVQGLGMEELASMDEGERNLLTVWVWTGCCMHKEMNSFKGGNTAMMAHWKEIGAMAPIRLANKDTAKAVQKILQPERGDAPMTAEDIKKLEDIASGGAKLTALAGAIFNNASDKKGQGDAHQLFMEHKLDVEGLERVKRFPQTNNTRFGSHGDAAVELITHLDIYRRFVEVIRVRKVTQTHTNIEKNVADGLKDGPTLTELSVLAIYHILIGIPYMRFVRQDEAKALNGVSLGPFHARVREQCELLIEQPELVLDFSPHSYPLASLDGESPDDTGLKLLSRTKVLYDADGLPHLREMFVKFVEGAMATWIRFSSEYAPGGIIDGLSEEMKERVYRPATNDVNEGALGSFVVWARNNPSGAVHTHNGIVMCQRNGTDTFARTFFDDEDHRFVMTTARRLDTEGLEKQRRRAQKDYDTKMLAAKEQAIAKKAARADAIRERLDSIPLIKSVDDIFIPGMTRDRLDDQLEKLRRLWNPDKKKPQRIAIPLKSHVPKLADKQNTLKEGFVAHLALLEQEMAAHGVGGLVGDDSDDETDGEKLDEDFWEEEDREMEEAY